MTITPMDIQNKEFERSFRGYDIEDVDEFLDRVAKDLEHLARENMELKEKLDQLQDKNKNYRKLEETMHNAIVVAQETAEEVKQNAKREADLIRREAEKEAQRIIDDARYRSSKILSEQEELFKQARVFKMRFRSFIEAQLSALGNEDWLLEAHEDQAKDNYNRNYENRSSFDSAAGFERSAPDLDDSRSSQDSEPGSKEDYDMKAAFEKSPDFNEDFNEDIDFGSIAGEKSKPEADYKPRSRSSNDFEAKRDFDVKPDFDPKPDFDFKPDLDPKYDFESTRQFDKKKGSKTKHDYDFDEDPDL